MYKPIQDTVHNLHTSEDTAVHQPLLCWDQLRRLH